MTIILRDYQLDLKNNTRIAFGKYKRVCAVGPTGMGKSAVLCSIISDAAAKNKRVLLVAHRRRLIQQLGETLARQGVKHGLIMSGMEPVDELVQVASIQTIARRLNTVEPPDLIVVDEAHHLTEGNQWGHLIEKFPKAFLLGLTATPERLDGKGLGAGYGGYFQHMIIGPSAAWLTENSFLAPARVFSWPLPENVKLKTSFGDFNENDAASQLQSATFLGDAVTEYKRHLSGKTAIANCCNVEHADAVCKAFNDAGVPSATITAKTPKAEQDLIYPALQSGKILVLCQVGVISEGVDIPSVSGAIMLRPTKSVVVWLQQLGRALRTADGKEHAIILDHVGNATRPGLGLPTDPRNWTLEGKKKRESTETVPSVKVCPDCFAALPGTTTECPLCGHVFATKKPKELSTHEGSLEELAPAGFRVGDFVKIKSGPLLAAAKAIKENRFRVESGIENGLIKLSYGKPKAHVHTRIEDLAPITGKQPHPAKGAKTIEELLAIAKDRGYKPSWAYKIHEYRRSRQSLYVKG